MTDAENAYRALQDAVSAYMAAEYDEAIVTGFVLYLAGQTIDDALMDPENGSHTKYGWAVKAGQPVHVTVGLAHLLVEDVTSTMQGEVGG